MNPDIKNLLDFTSFVNEIRKIKQALWVINEDVFENDCEHSYQLALTAMYIIDTKSLKLDAFKAMGLAIVHDIIEVHSGDTPAFIKKHDFNQKLENEKQAVIKLTKQWPKFTLLHNLIAEFEAKETPESKFIYALDKLAPILNNYLDNGRNWKREGISLDQLITVKQGKIDIDPTVNEYYKQILEVLSNHPNVF